MIKKDTVANLLEKRKWILFSLLSVATVILILFLPKYLSLVELLGKRIPQENIRLDYIKGFLWAIFLGSTILIWPVRSQDKKALMWIWAVKCFVMLGLMLFYEYHYQTDAFAYFSASKYDISQWKTMMFSAGSNFPVSTLIWLQNIFFLNSFHAAKVSFGMIGLVAIYIFYRGVVVFLRQEKLALLYIFAFFPSILFWSSILGKEPLALFCIAVYCYGVIKWIRIWSLSSAIIMLSGVVIAASLRPWLGLILGLPVFIITIQNVTLKKFRTQIVVLLILIPIVVFFTSRVMMGFDLKSSKDLVSVANQKFNGFARGGSVTGEKGVKEKGVKEEGVKEEGVKYKDSSDMILFVPRGMFTALFRPLPGEVNNVFGFLPGLEGAFLLILFGLALKRMRWRELLDPVCIWAILLIVIWAAAYAFISFNLGTVCRYRLQILPIFLGLLIYLAYGKNISNKMINTSK